MKHGKWVVALAAIVAANQAFAWCASGYDEYPDPYDANAKICVKHGDPAPQSVVPTSNANTDANSNANANSNSNNNANANSNVLNGGSNTNANTVVGGSNVNTVVGGSNTANGGAGGAGGAGGQGGKGGDSNATANGGAGGNATGGNATGGSVSHSGNSHSTSSAFQLQDQNQSQSIDHSGNSHSTSSTDSHNVTSNQLSNTGGNSQNANTSTSASSNNGSNVTVGGSSYQQTENHPASTAYAPTVINGSDQCLVTVSVGAQGMMFGVSFGSAHRDENCELMKLSDRLKALGRSDVAIELLSQDERVKKALDAVAARQQKPLARNEFDGQTLSCNGAGC